MIGGWMIGTSQLTREEDGGRSVSSADDGDRRGRFSVESHQDRHEVSSVHAELGRRAQEEAHGVRDQRSEIRHGADAHEDQGRKDTCFIKHVEIIKQASVSGLGFRRIHHNIRIDVHQKHTKGNRHQKQRLESLRDREVEKDQGHDDHDDIARGDGEECGLMNKV